MGVRQYGVVMAVASALGGSMWAPGAGRLVIRGERLTYNFLKDRPLKQAPSGSKDNDPPQHPLPPGHVLGQPAAAHCGQGGVCVP